jgi:tol-pal system protein YbgF
MKALLAKRHFLLILLCSPFLVQCIATAQDYRALDMRLRSLNNKLSSMDRNVNDLQEETTTRAEKSSVDDLQKNLADSANSLDSLKSQLMQLKGQLEENTHHVKKLREDETYYRDSLSTRFHDLSAGIESLRINQEELRISLAALEKKTQDNSTALQQTTGEVSRIKESQAAEASERARKTAEAASRAAREAEEARARKAAEASRIAREAEEARAKAKAAAAAASEPRVIEPDHNKKPVAAGETTTAAKAPAEKPAAKAASDPSQRLYDSGIAAFTAKKFQDAYAAFNEYIEKYPKGKLAGNARFWLGDSLYNQGEYELAILEYQKVIADYSNHPKSSAALLKQGLAFEKLKDLETAKLVYYKLEADYPKSEEAATAKKRLNSLK